jgi:hypothetical protein
LKKESSKAQTKLLFDTSSLITAAQFGVAGRLLIKSIVDYAQVIIPEGAKAEAVDLGLQAGYSDALELDRFQSRGDHGSQSPGSRSAIRNRCGCLRC